MEYHASFYINCDLPPNSDAFSMGDISQPRWLADTGDEPIRLSGEEPIGTSIVDVLKAKIRRRYGDRDTKVVLISYQAA